MQLHAKNNRDHIVSANQASRQENYFCLECQGVVRLRGGLHRQHHFYHVDPERPCRQHGKSLEHLQVQAYLKKILMYSELEVPFKEINRIADVVWFKEKIVFEVQCSPIAAEEIKSRNEDYESLGYRVVWIFHDSRYNRQRLSAAELSVRLSPHYFTNIDIDGNGHVYDQYDFLKRGQRNQRLEALTVNLASLKQRPQRLMHEPRIIGQRLGSWPIHFEGDLLDHLDHDYVVRALALEKAPAPIKTWRDRIQDVWFYGFVRPYLIGLQILLERASR